MKLDNHIAYRFLTDDTLMVEMVSTMYPNYRTDTTDKELEVKVMGLCDLVRKENQKAYRITNTVIDKLGMLKVKRVNEVLDWTVFSKIKDSKVTFIFPNNSLLRMQVCDDTLCFCYCRVEKMYDKNNGQLNWVLFYLNRVNGELCEHFEHKDVKEIEEWVYKLLCFMYLSENTEVLLEAGRKTGTKKSGKVINTLPIPLTIVDSNWNITSIRTDGFNVSGHFAIRWVGEGRTEAKMVYISPYEKSGYVRKSKK